MKFFEVKRFVKASVFSFTFMFLFAFAALAQVPMQQDAQEPAPQDFSDGDLEQFVTVYQKASEIQQKNEAEMMQAIEAEDLELDRFNEILVAQQSQQSPEEIDATAEEMASFNSAAEKIMQVQQAAQTEINGIIEEEMGAEKYQQIVMAYQQNPQLQEKVNQMLMENQGDQPGQQPQPNQQPQPGGME